MDIFHRYVLMITKIFAVPASMIYHVRVRTQTFQVLTSCSSYFTAALEALKGNDREDNEK